MKIPFTKMHGLGNDFMVVDCTARDLKLKPKLIKQLSDRNFGGGFDQLLLVEKASRKEVDFHYRIFNTDGTEVEHCGNGARCFAKFVRDKGLSSKNLINVSTINRNLTLTLHGDGEISVDMGHPEFDPSKIPFLCDSRLDTHERFIKISDEKTAISFSVLSMGNPHAVVCVEDLANTAVKDIGRALGSHPDFTEGVNVGFMEILSRDTIQLRVFERGTGETLACGSGACAAVVVGRLLEKLNSKVIVNLPGGQLTVCWDLSGSVIMKGPTQTVYEGIIEI